MNITAIKHEESAIFQRAALNGDIWPTEYDCDLNGVTVDKVEAFIELHPNARLGKINLYGNDDYRLIPAKGHRVHNFSYSFITPRYSRELEWLILERHLTPYTGTAQDSKLINEIFNLIEQLGGEQLFWV